MTVLQKRKLKFVKAIYGVEKFEKMETIQFGDKILVAWNLCGYQTLEDLEAEFSDENILNFFEQ